MGEPIVSNDSRSELPEDNNISGDFKIEDPTQQQVYKQLLSEASQEVADSYFGALYTLSQTGNPDRFRQAAHSLRSLNWFFTRGEETDESITNEEDDKSQTNTQPLQLSHKLKSQDPLGGAPTNLRKVIVDKFFELHKWLNRISKNPDTTEVELRKKLTELDNIILIITSSHFDIEQKIKEIVASTPTSENLESIKVYLGKDFRNTEVFFENADESWLGLLASDAVFFSEPPEQGLWPESQYLMRIAGVKPQEVMEIVLKIPQTSNLILRHNYVQIALNIQNGDIAAKIVDLIRTQKWFSEKISRMHFYGLEIGKLIEHLFKLGQTDKALELLEIALRFTPPETWKNRYTYPDAQPVLDHYLYEQIVKEVLANILDSAPCRIIGILAAKLSSAYHLERKHSTYTDEDDRDPREDHSYISITDLTNADMREDDVKAILAEGITLLLKKLGETNPDQLKSCISILDNPKFVQFIFKRIKLKILKEFPQLFQSEIESALIDPTNYDVFDELGGEFKELLEANFGISEESVKTKVLNILNQTPGHIQKLGEDKDSPRLIDLWRWKILNVIKTHLPQPESEWLKVKLEEFGEPHYSHIREAVWKGPTSSLTPQQLTEMAVVKIIEYLQNWKPSGEFMDDSVEGLGRSLSDAIKENPDKYSIVATEFVAAKLRFSYIYHLFWGLEQALRDNKEISWQIPIQAALDFVRLSQEEINSIPKDKERDIDYDTALKSIVSLLGHGLTSKTNEIPIELKESVWEIIKAGTDNPEPTPEYEKEYGGDNMEPLTMSINTTRGEAMHSLVKYGLWVSRHSPNPPFVEPEFMEALDKHLDEKVDPSVTIRSVYGVYLTNLLYLNKPWVLENMEKIFPHQESQSHLWAGAFGTYLSNVMYVDMFDLLKPQYEYAIQFAEHHPEYNKRVNLGESLAKHIGWAVAYGQSGAKEMAEQILNSNNEKTRDHFVWFIGANILKPIKIEDKDKKEYPDFENLKWIWEGVEDLPATTAEKFGYWFINSPFEKGFTINQFLKTLQCTGGKIDNDFRIVEKLKEYINEFPQKTLLSIELMITGDVNNWHTSSHIDDYLNILETAYTLNNPELNKIVKRIANTLGQRRYAGFEKFNN